MYMPCTGQTSLSCSVMSDITAWLSSSSSGAKSQIARLRFEGHHNGYDVLIGDGQTIQIMPGHPRLLRLGAVLAWGFAIGRIDFAHYPLRAHFQNTAKPVGLAIPQRHVHGRLSPAFRLFGFDMFSWRAAGPQAPSSASGSPSLCAALM